MIFFYVNEFILSLIRFQFDITIKNQIQTKNNALNKFNIKIQLVFILSLTFYTLNQLNALILLKPKFD